MFKMLFRIFFLITLIVNYSSSENLRNTKPLFNENCSDFAYNGVLEDLAINYLKYAKEIIKQNTAFIEVTKFDMILYKMAFSKCLIETLQDLKDKLTNDTKANILENTQVPLDVGTGESTNTPSKTFKTTSEPDLPFIQILFNTFKDSAIYVSEHLIKCTFNKFHSYQRFIANHINQSFELRLNTFNFISRLCNYELVRDKEEYNPILVQTRDKVIGYIENVNNNVNKIINSPDPLKEFQNILNNTSSKTTQETNSTHEYSHISYALTKSIMNSKQILDTYYNAIFVRKEINYQHQYLFSILGNILKFDVNVKLNNSNIQGNLNYYSDINVLFMSFLDKFYEDQFSFEIFKNIIPLFYDNYRISDMIAIIDKENNNKGNIDIKPEKYNIYKINDRLIKISLYDSSGNLVPNSIKETLVILAYMNSLFKENDKSIVEFLKKNKNVKLKYGAYFALKYIVQQKLFEFFKNEIYTKIKPFLGQNFQIEKIQIETAEDYEINKLINILNSLLKNLSITDSKNIAIQVINSTSLKLTLYNNTLKFRKNCNIYTSTKQRAICIALNNTLFKSFDLYAGLQENVNSIVQGFNDEVEEINSYTKDKQFNAKIDEIQIDYSYIINH